MDRSVLAPLRATRVRALVCASALTAGFSLLFACSKATQSDATPSIVPTAAAGQKAEPAVEQGIGAVLAAYESLRKALAGDDLAAAQASAKQVAEAATAATKTAAPTQTAGLEALAAAATAESKLPTSDATEVRKQFGEVSKHLITLLISDTKLQQGRYVFECPMAPGYRKWVQTETQVSNPYMGKRMLECGSPSQWT